ARAPLLAIYGKVLESLPERDDVRQRLVELAIQLGQVDLAIQHLKLLLDSSPENAAREEMLGDCYLLQSKGKAAEAAVDCYPGCVSHRPDSAAAYVKFASVLRTPLRRGEEAAQCMDELIKANGQSYEAYLARAQFRKEVGSIK